MSGILAQGARFHLLGMPRNYAFTVYLIDRALAEELAILVSCVIQMGADVSFRFRTVQMRKDTVNIDPLSYSGIPLQPELVIPQFGLSDKDQSHGALGIKFKVEQLYAI